jgi:hypothetical protein
MRRWPLSAGLVVAALAACGLLAAAGTPPPEAAGDQAMPGLHRQIPEAARQYVQPQQFRSPLTKEGFSANVVKTAPPVASYDYDFCPHPPFNTLAYTMVTDPASGWTALPDEFAYCPFSADQLKQILGAPKFNRKAPDGLPWLDPYPWEQFENAALLSAAAKQSPLTVGNLYMEAAWSVRLDVVSGTNDFDAEVAALFKPLPRRPSDPADMHTLYEMQLAHAWEQDRAGGVLKDVSPTRFALAMAWLYRSRGELAGAEHWLDEGLASDPQLGKGGGLYSFLRSSIRLERTYLRQAQAQFSAAWEAHLQPQQPVAIDASREGLTAFALAEISRRLGDLPAARSWYAEAEKTNYGTLKSDQLQYLEQLANGRGY